ncbi:SDR family NAD(P)-dependent oxidoreductase [Rathayibacter sp. KR2-224]|uniref:SDR family NAD(P)-dependent oxidoreductase n=1 Tax=Rathayibacter sp. KR2-224 TaxID=3400913 RepID=UPI003BFFB015
MRHRRQDRPLLSRRFRHRSIERSRIDDRSGARRVLVADLAENEGIQTVADRLSQGDVDVLVNNAGAGGYAPLATVTPEMVSQLWTLNAAAPLLLSRAILPRLLERGSGGTINVASLLAFSAGQRAPYLPARAIYASAKAGIVALSRLLAGEVAGTGVQVTLVCPGRVQTEFAEGAARSDPQAMTADDVAVAAWGAFSRGESVCIPALGNANDLQDLAAVELGLLEGGNRPSLNARYRT